MIPGKRQKTFDGMSSGEEESPVKELSIVHSPAPLTIPLRRDMPGRVVPWGNQELSPGMATSKDTDSLSSGNQDALDHRFANNDENLRDSFGNESSSSSSFNEREQKHGQLQLGDFETVPKHEEITFLSSHPKVRFSDIVGHSDAKLRMEEILLPLALPASLSDSILKGVRSMSPSVLLHGPPGCGKNKLAEAIAGEAGADFIQIGPSDILSKFVGESEFSIRKVFRDAYALATTNPNRCTVVFFDEIDALGQSRNGVDEGNGITGTAGGDSSSRRVLCELLIQLSALSKRNETKTSAVYHSGEESEPHPSRALETVSKAPRPRIIIVAATNRPKDVDSALYRRFSVRIQVGLPNLRDRRRMIKKFLEDISHGMTSEALRDLAVHTEGLSGSDLESLCREASMAPIRECIRRAAKIKRRAKEQQGGDESSQVVDRPIGGDEAGRYELMKGLNDLRPVKLMDFAAAFAFLYPQNPTSHPDGFSPMLDPHYDSSSDSDSS